MSFWRNLFGKGNDYSVDVNFDASIEELVRRGRYQYVESGSASTAFTTANYPPAQRGTTSLKLHLLAYQKTSIKDALRTLDGNKYRPATLHELLAFGERYPDVQMRTIVVAPGTQKETHPGYVSVPRLGMGGLGRLLDLQPISHDMNGLEWMLAAVPV